MSEVITYGSLVWNVAFMRQNIAFHSDHYHSHVSYVDSFAYTRHSHLSLLVFTALLALVIRNHWFLLLRSLSGVSGAYCYARAARPKAMIVTLHERRVSSIFWHFSYSCKTSAMKNDLRYDRQTNLSIRIHISKNLETTAFQLNELFLWMIVCSVYGKAVKKAKNVQIEWIGVCVCETHSVVALNWSIVTTKQVSILVWYGLQHIFTGWRPRVRLRTWTKISIVWLKQICYLFLIEIKSQL